MSTSWFLIQFGFMPSLRKSLLLLILDRMLHEVEVDVEILGYELVFDCSTLYRTYSFIFIR